MTLSSVHITDTTLGVSNIVGSLTLAPGASTNVTLTYNTTQADYNNGSVVDYAVANGTFNGKPVNSTATAAVTASWKPALTIQKLASPLNYNVA